MKNIDLINDLISKEKFDDAKTLLLELLSSNTQDVELLKLLGLVNTNLMLYNEAKDNFETVVKYDVTDATSWFYLANCYDNLSDNLHAQTAYEKVIELRENYLDAYKNLSVLYMKLLQEEKALDVAKKGLEIDSEDFMLNYIAGTASVATKNYKDSLGYFNKAKEINPEHVKIYNSLGTAYLVLGDYNNALKSYKKAAKLNPKDASAFYNIGSILQLKNKHVDACKNFKKAYEIDENVNYLASLALSAMKGEMFEDAIEYYKKLVAAAPQKPNYQYNLACCYDAVGQYTYAIRILEQLVIINPKSDMMQQKLATLYIQTEQRQRAKEIYEKLVMRGNTSAEVYYQYALLSAQLYDTDTAEKIFKKVLRLEPNNAIAHKDLGVIYLHKRLFDYAEDEFKTAYELEPNNFGIVFEYANYFYSVSQHEKAQEYYFKAQSINENDVILKTFIAMNKIELNDIEGAIEYVEKALALENDHEYILFMAGKIYYFAKQFERAKELLVRAVELKPDIETKNVLAQVYFEMGQYELANGIFKSLLNSHPGNITLLMSSAKCYEKLEQNDEALKQLEELVNIFPDDEAAHEMIRRLS